MHMWSLSQCLLSRGFKVVILTRSYDDRKGVRWMTNGLKVYYLPSLTVGNSVALPTLMFNFPLFRQIILREDISIVHCHQATSALSHACMLHSGTMGLPCVYTDHSLFSFNETLPILLNQLMRFSLSSVDHCIAVSHTCKENLTMRANLNPWKTSTIPNAIDPQLFLPNPGRRGDGLSVADRINIVILSRLVYRKGIHIAVNVIPRICQMYPNAHFIIGGDGDLRLPLQEMIEKHRLFDRVEMLGAVKHSDVCSVLTRGHIFLSCSLTESFCIAILEAACCGLHVVSTHVGGVPEVLPSEDITFATEASPTAVTEALSQVIDSVRRLPDPWEVHRRIRRYYSWHQVARRTISVYDMISADEENDKQKRRVNSNSTHDRAHLARPKIGSRRAVRGSRERIKNAWHSMQWQFKLVAVWIIVMDYIFYQIIKWIWPVDGIERALDVTMHGTSVGIASATTAATTTSSSSNSNDNDNSNDNREVHNVSNFVRDEANVVM